MLIETPVRPFDGFGSSRLAVDAAADTQRIVLAADPSASRQLVREHLPATPGVYGMVDAEGQLIYVGKSKSLRHRVLSYLAKSADGTKSKRIIQRAAEIAWEPTACEFSALVRELELIRQWRPVLNVRGQPGRSRATYLCLGRGPAAAAYLATKPPAGTAWVYGPLSAGRRSQRLVRRVNDQFGLRDCSGRTPVDFADQLGLFCRPERPRCLRFDLGTCLGPCVAACSRASYDEQVRRARRFLAGRDLSAMRALRQEMLEAAADRHFERAARLRDTWQDLDELRRHLVHVRRVRRRYSFVYPSSNPAGPWFFVIHGQVVAVGPAPNSRPAAAECLRLLEETFPGESPVRTPPPEDRDSLLLVAGWFRAQPSERARTLSPREAKQMCQPLT